MVRNVQFQKKNFFQENKLILLAFFATTLITGIFIFINYRHSQEEGFSSQAIITLPSSSNSITDNPRKASLSKNEKIKTTRTTISQPEEIVDSKEETLTKFNQEKFLSIKETQFFEIENTEISNQLNCNKISMDNYRHKIYINQDLNIMIPVTIDLNQIDDGWIWIKDNQVCLGFLNEENQENYFKSIRCYEIFEDEKARTLEKIVKEDFFAHLTLEQQKNCQVKSFQGTVMIKPIAESFTDDAKNICGDWAVEWEGTGYFMEIPDSQKYVFISHSWRGDYPIMPSLCETNYEVFNFIK